MQRINSWLMIFFIALICTGCGPKYSVLVDGITSQDFNHNINNSHYILLARDKDKLTDLYCEKFYNEVKNVFVKNGNSVVDNISYADYIAFIDYTTSEPHKRTVTESIPIFGETGVDTHTTFRQGPYGYVSQYTYTTPRYGTIGYNTYQRQEISYTHSLSVIAYKITDDFKVGKGIWQLIAVTSDDSSDIRKNMQPLLFILEKYMAKDTGGHLDVDIYEKDNKLVLGSEIFNYKKDTE